jgi:hypothetical protein
LIGRERNRTRDPGHLLFGEAEGLKAVAYCLIGAAGAARKRCRTLTESGVPEKAGDLEGFCLVLDEVFEITIKFLPQHHHCHFVIKRTAFNAILFIQIGNYVAL